MCAGLGLGAAAGPAQAQDALVFAAASLKNALDEIATRWQRESGKTLRISYAASSALMKQIELGAPADLFFSADRDWMDYGERKGLIRPETGRTCWETASCWWRRRTQP
jgi:molybdate transport system substrate-binding protein